MIGKVVTFGEIMLRLSPPNFKRLIQTQSYNLVFGGGEANVAVSLANYGIPVDFITKLPNSEIGEACIQSLRKYGVNTNNIVRGGDRIGIYFLEMGSSVRSSKVIYDRAHSAISEADPEDFNWNQIFDGASWFHWTGITPAISQKLANICLEAVKAAKERRITVSCDLNYRSKLWKYGKEPRQIIPELVKYCDIAIGNEEDAEKVLDIKAPDTDVTSGKLEAENYRYVVEEMKKQYQNLKKVAITLRGSISASFNTWSAILYDGNKIYIGPQYDITPIVDRVGGGDSFMGGLIYGLLTYKEDLQTALNFAIAASCLKHTIIGDFNLVSVEEVLKLMDGDTSGRVSR
ncbi:MAG: PfkB family carbohydrate kinase [Candidatus Thorarchaeota archaeon]